MHPPDFYFYGTPLYVHPWIQFGEVLVVNDVPGFPPGQIVLVSKTTLGHWMMTNLAAAYWPEGVRPEWIRL